MKNLFNRNGIKFFIGGLFVVAIALTMLLHSSTEKTEIPPGKELQGVVPSDTIQGDITIDKNDTINIKGE